MTSSDHRPISSVLPEYLSRVLPYENLNQMQEECLKTWETDANMLISAPTGAGKTLCFELAILRVLHRALGTTTKKKLTSALRNEIGKIVYLAPTKSLCAERAQDWERKFQHLGLRVKAVTGDLPSASFDSTLRNIDLVVATAEKWDSVTRNLRAKNPSEISSQIQLMLLDEIHQVGDRRGAVYEAVISRMLLTHENSSTSASAGGKAAPAASLRVIAVSATIANVKDFAMWLRVSEGNMMVFDEKYRPVELEHHVLGYSASNPWMYGKVYDRHMLSVVSKYSEGKPSIVFCSSRRQTVTSAEALLDKLNSRSSQTQMNPFLRTMSQEHKSRLSSCAQECSNTLLQRLLPQSIAIHNADLNVRERNLVETLFRDCVIGCLFSTSTLAQAVNLPARLVVIAGTTFYSNGSLQEYQRNLIQQMSGRAGRPGLDSKGVVVIMTSRSQVATYNNIHKTVSNKVVSQLSSSVGEALNAEVARQVVINLPTAVAFLSNTLFCRQQKPTCDKPVTGCDSNAQDWLHSVAVSSINSLRDENLLQYDADHFGLSCTLPGTLMAKYCLSVATMELLMKELPTASSPSQILRIVASCSEVQEGVSLRRSERKRLNMMNEWIRMPLRGKVEGLRDKVVILIQIAIGDVRRFSSCDIALRNEARKLHQSASRVSACIIALVLHNALNIRYETALAALQLCRGLQNRCFWDGPTLLRQVPGISSSDVRALNKAGVLTLAKLATLNSEDLDRAGVCRSGFTDTLKERMRAFPNFVVRAEALLEHSQERQALSVSVDVNVSSMCGHEKPRQRAAVNCFIMAGVPNANLLKCHIFPLCDGHGSVTCYLPAESHGSVNGIVDILVGCDTICGTDVKTSVRCGESKISPSEAMASEPNRMNHSTSVKEGRITKKRSQTKLKSGHTPLPTTSVAQQMSEPENWNVSSLTSFPEAETQADTPSQTEGRHNQTTVKPALFSGTIPSIERTMMDMNSQTRNGVPTSDIGTKSMLLAEGETEDASSLNCGFPSRGERKQDHCASSEPKQTPARYESHLPVSTYQPTCESRQEYDDVLRGLF